MEVIKQETDEATGIVLKFHPDSDLERPYEGDAAVKIVILHGRYINPAEGDIDTVEEAFAFEAANRPGRVKGGTAWAIFPLYLYDHSGCAYRVANEARNPFIGRLPQGHAEFDSGRVGFIALKRSEWGPSAPRTSRKALLRIAEGIAESYTAWVNGGGVGYVVEDAEGEELDSCWGYYTLDDAEQAGREALAHHVDGAKEARGFEAGKAAAREGAPA